MDYKALKKEVVMDAHYDSDVDEPQLELISGFTLVTHSVEPWVPVLPFSFLFCLATSLIIPSLILQIWKKIFKFGDFQERKKHPSLKIRSTSTPHCTWSQMWIIWYGARETFYYYYYLGSFNTNYIIFRKCWNFQKLISFLIKKKLWKKILNFEDYSLLFFSKMINFKIN